MAYVGLHFHVNWCFQILQHTCTVRIRESILVKILVTKIARIKMDSRKFISLSYKVIWQESMDSCKILLGEFKWILAPDSEFLTLRASL